LCCGSVRGASRTNSPTIRQAITKMTGTNSNRIAVASVVDGLGERNVSKSCTTPGTHRETRTRLAMKVTSQGFCTAAARANALQATSTIRETYPVHTQVQSVQHPMRAQKTMTTTNARNKIHSFPTLEKTVEIPPSSRRTEAPNVTGYHQDHGRPIAVCIMIGRNTSRQHSINSSHSNPDKRISGNWHTTGS
jgi:hypothetical protein